jgi:hypothetical protein
MIPNPNPNHKPNLTLTRTRTRTLTLTLLLTIIKALTPYDTMKRQTMEKNARIEVRKKSISVRSTTERGNREPAGINTAITTAFTTANR